MYIWCPWQNNKFFSILIILKQMLFYQFTRWCQKLSLSTGWCHILRSFWNIWNTEWNHRRCLVLQNLTCSNRNLRNLPDLHPIPSNAAFQKSDNSVYHKCLTTDLLYFFSALHKYLIWCLNYCENKRTSPNCRNSGFDLTWFLITSKQLNRSNIYNPNSVYLFAEISKTVLWNMTRTHILRPPSYLLDIKTITTMLM